ncbi:MAG TPA: heme exporter protein CcmB [Brevundimonas sp.]|jgi:heme exporter protein B|uniref:heme exporter protein CcmB n=1 Tax=Brevundimonas sp. TaxID=1871086 RepID=UPI002DF70B1F|nr:heme exporter protein CcmB [Brevundimonas sp.]
MSALMLLFRRELALLWSGGGGPLLACGFALAATAALPLAIGSEPVRLVPIAAGATWIVLALASLLSLERLFERDHEDGALDLLALGPLTLEAVFAVKAAAQWTAVGLPLALAAPVAALALGLDPALAPLTAGVAALAGLGFAAVGALAAALSLGSKRGGLLVAVIALPLYAPPVIFGAGAIAAAQEGTSPAPALALLTAYALFACALSPFAGGAAIRNAQG